MGIMRREGIRAHRRRKCTRLSCIWCIGTNQKYSSPKQPASLMALAVLGMFLEVGEKHEELDKVLKLLEKIKFKGRQGVAV